MRVRERVERPGSFTARQDLQAQHEPVQQPVVELLRKVVGGSQPRTLAQDRLELIVAVDHKHASQLARRNLPINHADIRIPELSPGALLDALED